MGFYLLCNIQVNIYELTFAAISTNVLTGITPKLSYRAEPLGHNDLVNARKLLVQVSVKISLTLVAFLLDAVQDFNTFEQLSSTHILNDKLILEVSP